MLARVRRSDPLDGLTEREREVLARHGGPVQPGDRGEALPQRPDHRDPRVSIFTKLDLAEVGAEDNRRVLAVLTYLRA